MGTAEAEILKRELRTVSVIRRASRKAKRLKRLARSSLAIEVQAMAAAQEEIHNCRCVWTDPCTDEAVELTKHVEAIRMVRATMPIDCKSLYDSTTRTMSAGAGWQTRGAPLRHWRSAKWRA